MKLYKVILVLIVFFLVSCFRFPFYKNTKGAYTPYKPEYTLNSKQVRENNKLFQKHIDTAVVYLKTDTVKYSDSDYGWIYYLKFYNNGRLHLASKDIDKAIEQKDLTEADFGYYSLYQDKIEIEYFLPDLTNTSFFKKNRSEYIRRKGFIRNDTIFLGGAYYVKEKLEFIPESFNWQPFVLKERCYKRGPLTYLLLFLFRP